MEAHGERLAGRLVRSCLPPRPPLGTTGAALGALSLTAAVFAPDVDAGTRLTRLPLWLFANLAGSAAVFYTVMGARVATRSKWAERATARQRWIVAISIAAGGAASLLIRSKVQRLLESGHRPIELSFALVLGPVVHLAVLGTAFWAAGQRRILRSALGALEHRVEQLRSTRHLLATAEDGVRRAVAERLHGRVQSRLVVGESLLSQVMDDDAVPAHHRTALADAIEILRDVRENEIRVVSHELYPPQLRVSLVAAIRAIVDQMSRDGTIEVSLSVTDSFAVLDGWGSTALDLPTRLVLYRSVEESLQNARVHGDAQSVQIELDHQRDEISLRVIDDGRGLSVGSGLGLGLSVVDDRVRSIGGEWSLQRAGDCTVFDCRIPRRSVPAESPNDSAGPLPSANTPRPAPELNGRARETTSRPAPVDARSGPLP